jgi:hypothetical protein
MMNLRDSDVHYGETDAESLPTMVEAEINEGFAQNFNAAFFGPRPVTEHKNPDGTTVRSVYAGAPRENQSAFARLE